MQLQNQLQQIPDEIQLRAPVAAAVSSGARLIHLKMAYRCEQCDRRFNDKQSLEVHVKFRHEQGGTQFMCSVCELIFSSSDERETHERIQHDVKRARCHILLLV
jgi:rubredoxin